MNAQKSNVQPTPVQKSGAPKANAQKFNQERLMNILLAPQISEKATSIAEKNRQVIFRVTPEATKPEIKAAVELMFKVVVDNVQVACVKGKKKRFGAVNGQRKDWKKAYVCLALGQEINFAASEQG